MTKSEININGKEYFTTEEAAHYCCCCSSKFRAYAPTVGIRSARRFGKIVYRRADCRDYMESAFVAA